MAHKNRLVIYKGITRPSIYDTILVEGKKFDLTGVTAVRFYMRYAHSEVLKIDAGIGEVEGDPKNGRVRYDPVNDDVDEAGEFYAWWRITLADGAVQDSDEFYVAVDEHSPGVGVKFGAIADRVRGYMPATFDGLSRWPTFGDRRIQDAIEKVKLQTLNTSVSVEQEASLNLLVQSFIAKKASLELIPAGRDYWMVQVQSHTSNDPDSSESYPDRIRSLSELEQSLQLQIVKDEIDVLPLIPNVRLRTDGPKISEPSVSRVTSDPADFPSYESFPCRNERSLL